MSNLTELEKDIIKTPMMYVDCTRAIVKGDEIKLSIALGNYKNKYKRRSTHYVDLDFAIKVLMEYNFIEEYDEDLGVVKNSVEVDRGGEFETIITKEEVTDFIQNAPCNLSWVLKSKLELNQSISSKKAA